MRLAVVDGRILKAQEIWIETYAYEHQRYKKREHWPLVRQAKSKPSHLASLFFV